jgi:hypothetical protein
MTSPVSARAFWAALFIFVFCASVWTSSFSLTELKSSIVIVGCVLAGSLVAIFLRFGKTRSNQLIRIIFSILCLVVVASNFWTMRKWTERTGVYDDLCYLRQAHLFQRFGLDGLNTDLSRDDDQYFARLAREIGYAGWSDPSLAPCHPLIGSKRVIQYPPGTGFMLSIFPEGFQRVPLYGLATLAVLLAALTAIWIARSRCWIMVSGVVGISALYFMINPAKASFSIAPTMAVCAIVGFLTNAMLDPETRRGYPVVTALIGLLLGLAVSFRLPNLFLSAGYFLVLAAVAARTRTLGGVLPLMSFGVSYAAGLAPTLIANAINAGSPFSTTYGSADVVPPDFGFSIVRDYMTDLQGPLMVAVVAWTAIALMAGKRKAVPTIVAANLVTNLVFFLSHPIFTPYYLMPFAMLSIWTLVFTTDEPHLRSLLGAKGPASRGPSVR